MKPSEYAQIKMTILAFLLWTGPMMPAVKGAGVMPRLAVLAGDESLRRPLDVLTSNWSKREGLALVERADIERVYQELRDSAASRAGLLKLGQTLSADGVLNVESVREGESRKLQVSLVSVGPGVVLQSIRYPGDIPDPVEWSDLVWRHFGVLLPKLTTPRTNAIPVSILNLRSLTATREAVVLEKELTSLLIHRLAREPAVFVLERQRLDALEMEKSFVGGQADRFWNGAHTVEGAITELGGGRISVSAHIKASDNRAFVLESSGAANELPALVNDLAERLLLALKSQSKAPAQDPLVEAASYYEEAKLAMRWNVFEEAQSAAEACWALGLHTRESAELRVQVYSSQTVLGGGPALQFGFLFAPGPAPQEGAVQAGVRALENYLQHTLNPPVTNMVGDAWHKLGAEVLARTGALLWYFQNARGLTGEQSKSLASLRSAAREVAAKLRTDPKGRAVSEMALITYAGLFEEDVKASVRAYGELLASGAYERNLRKDVGFNSRQKFLPPPPLVTWNQAEQLHLAQHWDAQLQRLGAGENPNSALGALYWRLVGAQSDYAREDAIQDLIAALERLKEAVFTGVVSDPLWNSIDAELARLVPEKPAAGETRFTTRWRQMLEPVRKADYNESRRVSLSAQALKELKVLLSKPPSELVNGIDALNYTPPAWTPMDAQEAAALCADYQNQHGRALGVASLVLSKIRTGAHDVMRTAGLLPTPKATSFPAPSAPVVPESTPSLPTVQAAFWPLPPFSRFSSPGAVVSVRWQEDHFWVEASYRGDGTAIFGLDGNLDRIDTVDTPWMDRTYLDVFNSDIFAVAGRWLYVITPEGLKKRDWQNHTWLPVQPDLPVVNALRSIGGRVYAVSGEGLFEINPATDEVRVLASCRRRPPQNEVDALERFEQPQLWQAAPDQLGFVTSGNVFVLELASGNWRQAGRFGDWRKWRQIADGTGNFVGLRSTPEMSILGWMRGVRLDADPRRDLQSLMELTNVTKEAYRPGMPYERLSEVVSIAGAWVGDTVWTASGAVVPETEPGSKTASIFTLSSFPAGKGIPSSVGVRFTAPKVDGAVWRNLMGANPYRRNVLAISPETMLLGQSGMPGLWAIPMSSLRTLGQQPPSQPSAPNAMQQPKPVLAPEVQASRKTEAFGTLDKRRESADYLRNERKGRSILRHRSQLAILWGPVPMLSDSQTSYRFMAAGILTLCLGGILAVGLKRSKVNMLLLAVAVAVWLAVGHFY